MRNLFQFLWKYNVFILFLILEIIAFTLIIKNTNYQRAVIISSSNKITGSILEISSNISQYFGLRKANKILANENAMLKSLSKNSYIVTDNNIIEVNDTLYRQQYEYISAMVINNSVNRRNNYLTLNKGFKQGITKDMAVIAPNGVIGIVTTTSENFSSVISILHEKSRLVAKIKKNDYPGTLIWKGNNSYYADLTDVPTHVEVEIGDTIVTGSYSNLFPEGILIGTVAEVSNKKGEDFLSIKVLFSIDYRCVTWVYVVKNLMKEELENLIENSEKE
jgi:rod shape-determining protein MreC